MKPGDMPAFPGGIPIGQQQLHEGLTKREWFAGMAPPAPDLWTVSPMPSGSAATVDDWSEWVVRRAVSWAYTYADAMIAASKEEGGE